MVARNKKVCGVGVNDSDYKVAESKGGKQVWVCPYYTVWKSMIRRCYSENSYVTNPTYRGCTVCDEWLIFSSFKSWMTCQDWQGKCLDKDLLIKGNKVYSPNSCVFISRDLNSFLTDRAKHRGGTPLGVNFHKRDHKFYASCCDGKGGKTHLGVFNCPEKAHLAWRKEKHRIACQYAALETNTAIVNALLTRYS